MSDSTLRSRAERAFKKSCQQAGRTQAWNEHEAREASVAANTKRLKELRLAREAREQKKTSKS